MARLLPFRQSDQSLAPREPRLVELDDEHADAVFAALSAETARAILRRLYESPGTATDVAKAADTSLQNARYHLEKLQSAELVEAVDIWYSSRGTEMTVYAPTSEPLVVAAGPDEQTSVLRSALGRLVGALGVLGIASVVVDRLARFGLSGIAPGATAGADSADVDFQATTPQFEGDGANATVTPNPTADDTATAAREAATPTTLADAGDAGMFDLAGGLPPGGLFFLGGLIVLLAIAGWWYWRRYRPLYG